MSSPFEPERRPAHDEWQGQQAQPNRPVQAGQYPANYPQAGQYPQSGTAYYYAQPLPGSSPYALPAAATPYTASTQPPKRKRGRRIVAGTLAAVAIAAVGGVAGAAAVGFGRNKSDAPTSSNSTATPVQTVVNSSNASITNVVKAVDPVVVSLTVKGANEEDEGSGIVLKSTGLILTNNHVISAAEDGGTVTVTFTDGKTANATIVAADASEDLAIVQASGVSGIPVATLANSNSVQVGDTVVAIGNELGLSNSVSSGIVSALHRQISVASDDNTPLQGEGRNYNGQNSSGTTYSNAIQTDAAINQGDSGGALFNMQGQVIGIDSAIATGDSESSGSVGVGFAIAINDAAAFIKANS
jgi:putative serine protease PepD